MPVTREVGLANAGRGHRAERLGGALGATRARVAPGFASARENHDGAEEAEAAQAGKRRRLRNAPGARALDAATREKGTRGVSREVRKDQRGHRTRACVCVTRLRDGLWTSLLWLCVYVTLLPFWFQTGRVFFPQSSARA